MSRARTPRRDRRSDNELRRVTLSAALSGLIRFVLDQLSGLL